MDDAPAASLASWQELLREELRGVDAALCQQVCRREFGSQADVQVIHAGLECGLLAASHPDLDIVSSGPTIRGAHAPGERVEIATVAQTWQLLKAILAMIAAVETGAEPMAR